MNKWFKLGLVTYLSAVFAFGCTEINPKTKKSTPKNSPNSEEIINYVLDFDYYNSLERAYSVTVTEVYRSDGTKKQTINVFGPGLQKENKHVHRINTYVDEGLDNSLDTAIVREVSPTINENDEPSIDNNTISTNTGGNISHTENIGYIIQKQNIRLAKMVVRKYNDPVNANWIKNYVVADKENETYTFSYENYLLTVAGDVLQSIERNTNSLKSRPK